MGRDTWSAVVTAAALSLLMLLLLAGHGPWAGRPLVTLADDRGINAGDIPVLATWVVGLVGIARLYRSASRDRSRR